MTQQTSGSLLTKNFKFIATACDMSLLICPKDFWCPLCVPNHLLQGNNENGTTVCFILPGWVDGSQPRADSQSLSRCQDIRQVDFVKVMNSYEIRGT
jgi:hypothetical protein